MSVDEFETDEISGIQSSIVELLSELAKTTDRPDAVDASDLKEFDSNIFNSNMWITIVLKLQDWMQFSSRIDTDLEPNMAIRKLLEGLGLENAAAGVSEANDDKLSLTGLEALYERLEKAVNAKNEFIETLGEEGRESAESKWKANWEDEISDFGNEPIKATTKTLYIKRFIEFSTEGELDLTPAYQRGDVWPTGDAQKLIESILQGIPLPSIILLKPTGNLHHKYEVVDGKQRLTSILRYIGKHPVALKTVAEVNAKYPSSDLLTLFSTDYPAFRKKWKAVTGEPLTAKKEKTFFFPFPLSKDMKPLQEDIKSFKGKYYSEIRNSEINIAGNPSFVKDIFESHMTDYEIPVITYTQATPSQIHRVFNLYNKQGKHLNAEEIRNAVYHDVELLAVLFSLSADHPKISDDVVQKGGNKSLANDEGFKELVKVKPWLELPAIEISEILANYIPSGARYKRTKLLSWLVSILLSDLKKDGNPQLLSTSGQIDALLKQVQSDPEHLLRSDSKLNELSQCLHRIFNVHAISENAWKGKFKNATNSNTWQELQLVGSLLGVALAESVLGEDLEDVFQEHEKSINELTKTDAWKRPKKTQTNTQWNYISRIAIGLLNHLGISTDQVNLALNAKYGASPIEVLIENSLKPYDND